VQRHAALQPLGVGHCARHEKDVFDSVRLHNPSGTAPGDPFETAVALERDELCTTVQRDVRALLDSPYQVAGHAVCETIRAHQYVNVATSAGEKHGRLARRISPTHAGDVFASAQLCFQ